MAEIKKIKVDGVEYDIGSNLGAELEWKLVASGFYDDTQSNDNMIEYLLDKKLEENKLYYIERYDGNFGSMYHCFFKRDYDCYIRATDRENDESCEVYLAGYESDRGYRIQLVPDTPIYYGENDDIKVYELAIKNVVNPGNVGIGSEVQAELDKKQDKLTAGEGITIENNVISTCSEFVTLKQTDGRVTVTYFDENDTEYNELGSFYVDIVRLKFVNTEVIDIDKPIRINLISTSVDTDLDGRSAVVLHWTNEGYTRVFLDKYNYDIGIDPVSGFLLINSDMEEDCYIDFKVSSLLYDTSDIRKLSFEIVGHKQNQFTNPSSFVEL